MVKGRALTESQRGVFKFTTNDVSSLGGKLLACRCRHDRGGKNKPLQWAKSGPIHKSYQVKVTKYFPFALVYPVSKAVRKKWIPRKSLSLLNQESKCKRGRVVKRRSSCRRGQPSLRMNDEPSDEMKISVEAVLFRQLQHITQTRMSDRVFCECF